MTVEDGKITNVELTECHETPSIASVAMERLPQLMVEHQTTTLDNVTGATLASGAHHAGRFGRKPRPPAWTWTS